MLILPYKLPLKKCEGALLVRYNTCMKTIQWDKLWYNFPVLAQSHSGKRAGSFFQKGQSSGIAKHHRS